MQVEIGAELQPAIGVRQGQRALDVVGHRLAGRVGNIVERQDNHVVAHADPAVLGKPWMEGQSEADLAVQDKLLAAVKNGEPFAYDGYSNTLGTEVHRIVMPVHVTGTDAKLAVVVNVPLATLNAASSSITTMIVGVGVVLLIVVALSIYLVGNTIVRRPLERAVRSIQPGTGASVQAFVRTGSPGCTPTARSAVASA